VIGKEEMEVFSVGAGNHGDAFAKPAQQTLFPAASAMRAKIEITKRYWLGLGA
jgi:threonine dehydratase